ncbi:MAG: cardiolipin synthase [Halieaceae bacterium]
MLTELAGISLLLAVIAIIVRILLRSHRTPSSRVAWITIVIALPLLGIAAYLLLGEVNLGRRRIEQLQKNKQILPPPSTVSAPYSETSASAEQDRFAQLFKLGQSISGFQAEDGNRAQLMTDSNSAIDAMVADIDKARESVHLSFYIWLSDRNGSKVIDAVKRAASRGVSCRALADGLGSRSLIKSKHWKDMQKSGAQVAVALPVSNPLLSPLLGRIDLRNHRKIAVIDNAISYCGSQNCADPEFLPKARYAPWVDILLRFTGPVVTQNQYLFVTDWMLATEENLSHMLLPANDKVAGFTAQVVGTGPNYRFSAMPELLVGLLTTARQQLTISTPYYVPNESMQDALCATAYRGVNTTLILPARNDSRFVAAASKSCYADLLTAGVRIMEFEGGLLHAKTLTMDGQITLVGSTNLDRRSFEINFENNILLRDSAITAAVLQRQEEYITASREVTLAQLESWSLGSRLLNNSLAMLAPVL